MEFEGFVPPEFWGYVTNFAPHTGGGGVERERGGGEREARLMRERGSPPHDANEKPSPSSSSTLGLDPLLPSSSKGKPSMPSVSASSLNVPYATPARPTHLSRFGCRVQGSGFRVQGSGFRVQRLGRRECWVWGVGCGVYNAGR